MVERTAQLTARNRKLAMMDTALCRSFAVDSSNDLVEQSLIFQLCHEFIRISRALRYSPHQESLPTFIKQIYLMDSTKAIWRFGTGLLSGFLLPVVLGAVCPRSVEHECNDDCGPSEMNDLMSKCMIKTDGCNACAKVEQHQRDDADVESK